VSEAAPPEEVLELLGDEYVRAILTATSDEPMSAKAISEATGMSLPTVYRRVDDLLELDLVIEQTRVDVDGHHYTVYRPAIHRVTVDVDAELSATVEYREDAVDRFTRVWRDIRGD
jgi:DNA-binding transcriptional ArsR family regulator